MGLGSRGIRLTGVVQEEHQRDPPGQHGVPGPYQDPRVEKRPGRHRLGPGPHPEEAPRGAGSRRERGRGHPGIGGSGGGRGRIGLERLPIGWQLQPSRPSSQQVPEDVGGGAGARAAGYSSTSSPHQPGNFGKPRSRRES